MIPITKRAVAISAALLTAGGLAACSSTSTPSGPSSGPPSKPTGVLRLVAASGFDHLDPVSAYYTADYILERAYTRQLLAYPYAVPLAVGDAQWNKAVTPVADDLQRRDHQWRADLHLPHPARRDLADRRPGDLRGLPARVQGVLQPGARRLRGQHRVL